MAQIDYRSFLRRGDRIVVSQMSGEPLALTRQLVAQRHELEDIEVFIGVLNDTGFTPMSADRLRFRSFGAMGNARPLHAAGALGIVPISLGRIGTAILDGAVGCDVALVQLTPTSDPDLFGFGVTCDYMRAAIDRARVVVAEINSAVPRMAGTEFVRRDEIDILIDSDRPPPQLPARAPRELDRLIAANVTDLIEDGATLQVGIGGVPDALLGAIGDRRNLGYHGGMLSDGIAALMQSGALMNSRKAIDPGESVTAMISGSRELFRFVDGNPRISLRSSTYTNDVATIAAQSRFVAINSALEVDLTGAVNAESIGGKHIGGTGGLPDFAMGAAAAQGGRSVIALSSTAAGGTGTRIVARLNGPVTVPAYLADVIATEFGRAELRGKSLRERALALIAIAAPHARDALRAEARHAGFLC
ncbi:acyl-CoA hydrolase [Hephaestia caeni]|uniref:Acyl-CoA hydrolase n=1 Tax=Hephaestia caeni TaxID=645617 RepID=A0A397P7H2_9SPHN|nr:acetyl-CoA hydrolase/transferase C-terminal domain-containing protein [Hephaestia caeni]RIA45496.1 acyl-CoA hydrolase [Hephaestia caeni]